MRRFAIPTLGVLLFSLCALLISGCSKKEAKSAANPRLVKSGQLLADEPIVPVAKDSSETVVAEGEEIEAANLYTRLWQSFAILLPIKTVGIMGDSRTYENVIAIRAVNSTDEMTADWAHLPYDLLGRISNRVINEVKGINRVVYDISSKPPGTIEWE